MYIYIYVYIYIWLYIYVCVNLCIYMYIYIYVSVCVGGCHLKMRCPFFLSKNPFRNQKKTPRFETYPCIYNILFFLTCVVCFYPVLVCPIQNICFLVFFCMQFFQHHFIGKMYQINKCLIGGYNIDIVLYIKKTQLLQKRYQYRLFI